MIEYLNNAADSWFSWQFEMLWQVSLLIAIVFTIDLLIRRWAWPQVRYMLWMLIFVKLVLPVGLSSPLSLRALLDLFQNEKVVSTPTIPAYDYTPAPTYTPTAIVETSTIPDNPMLSLKALAMIVWVTVAAVLSVWLLIKLSNLRRNHVNTSLNPQIPKWFDEVLEETALKLKLKNLPKILLTDKVKCPAVFGVFKPILLMPASTINTLSKEDAEHIFLHELAHIKRGDLTVHAVCMCLQIVYWFNPLLWLIRKPIQNLRELCCDGTVARILKDKTYSYRNTLIETAKQLLAEPVDPGMGLLGLFENSCWLVERLKWLEKTTWKNRPLKIATVTVLSIAMFGFVIPMAKAEHNFFSKDKKPDSAEPSLVNQSDYKATFSNGATIEFVGVKNYSKDDMQWWRPDGSLFDPAYKLRPTGFVSSDGKPYILAVDVSCNEDYGFTWKRVEGAMGSSGINIYDLNGNQLKNIKANKFNIKEKFESCDVEVGLAAGEWIIESKHDAKSTLMQTSQNHSIAFGKKYQTEKGTEVTVSDDYLDNQFRVTAITKDGKEHITQTLSCTSSNKMRQSTIVFKDLKADDIKEFQFQRRPYEYVTFKNVCLNPNGKKVETEKAPDPFISYSVANADMTRRVVLKNCVWMDDIKADDEVDVLDLASGKICKFTGYDKEPDFFRAVNSADKGDVYVCYRAKHHKPMITFFKSAGLGGENATDEHQCVSPTPMTIPWETTVETKNGCEYEFTLTDFDEEKCYITYKPVNKKAKKFFTANKQAEYTISSTRSSSVPTVAEPKDMMAIEEDFKVSESVSADEIFTNGVIGQIDIPIGAEGKITSKYGDAIYGNNQQYSPLLYLGRVSSGQTVKLEDNKVYYNQFTIPIIKIKTTATAKSSPRAGTVGWISLSCTNFADKFRPSPDSQLPEHFKQLQKQNFDRSMEQYMVSRPGRISSKKVSRYISEKPTVLIKTKYLSVPKNFMDDISHVVTVSNNGKQILDDKQFDTIMQIARANSDVIFITSPSVTVDNDETATISTHADPSEEQTSLEEFVKGISMEISPKITKEQNILLDMKTVFVTPYTGDAKPNVTYRGKKVYGQAATEVSTEIVIPDGGWLLMGSYEYGTDVREDGSRIDKKLLILMEAEIK